jgi:hypothetical protein
MTAVNGSDASGTIEYYFEEMAGNIIIGILITVLIIYY